MYSDDQSGDFDPTADAMQEPQRDAVPEQAYAEMPRESPWRKVAAVAATVSAGFFGVYVVWRMFGTDAIVDALREYWPVLLSPIAGALLARFVVRSLYHPSGRVLVHLDVETHLLRAVFVPDDMFRYIQQTGNNVVYHTMSGIPVYLVEGMDLVNGRVDYGWVHEADPMVVMTREETYRKWHDTLDEALAENLRLIANPKVIGLGYARRMLREHLDRISGAVGLDVPDYDHHSTFDEGSDQGDVSVTDRDSQSGDGVPNVPFGGHGGERHG